MHVIDTSGPVTDGEDPNVAMLSGDAGLATPFGLPPLSFWNEISYGMGKWYEDLSAHWANANDAQRRALVASVIAGIATIIAIAAVCIGSFGVGCLAAAVVLPLAVTYLTYHAASYLQDIPPDPEGLAFALDIVTMVDIAVGAGFGLVGLARLAVRGATRSRTSGRTRSRSWCRALCTGRGRRTSR